MEKSGEKSFYLYAVAITAVHYLWEHIPYIIKAVNSFYLYTN